MRTVIKFFYNAVNILLQIRNGTSEMIIDVTPRAMFGFFVMMYMLGVAEIQQYNFDLVSFAGWFKFLFFITLAFFIFADLRDVIESIAKFLAMLVSIFIIMSNPENLRSILESIKSSASLPAAIMGLIIAFVVAALLAHVAQNFIAWLFKGKIFER